MHFSKFDDLEEEEEEEEEEEGEIPVVKAEIERVLELSKEESKEEVLILPEGFSKAKTEIQLTTVIAGITKDPAVKIPALTKLSRVLGEVTNEPSALLPTRVLGHLVAVTCLCALESTCSWKAAETLCQLLPLLRRREEKLRGTPWGGEVIERALAVTADGESPSLFQSNAYNQARVFGAYLPAQQQLEAVQLLAELPDSFSCLDGFHLLKELLEQFLEKTLRIEDVLDRLCQPQGHSEPPQKPVAFLVLPVVAQNNLEKVLEYFLNYPFSDYQENWKVLLGSARHSEIFNQLAEWMPNVTGQAKCAVEVLQDFLRSAGTASKRILKEVFPQLSLALLGHIYTCGRGQEELIKLAQATLRDLFRAVGIKRSDLNCQILGGSNTFRDGLSTFVRLLINQGAWTIPILTAYIVRILEGENETLVPEVAIVIYIELFLHRRCVLAEIRTVDYFCHWLGHSNVQVRQLSLQGLTLLLESEMDPWTLQLAVLSSLGSAVHGDIIPDLMDLMETILPMLSDGEWEEAYIRSLTTIYVEHMAHEDTRARAAAIQHLCMLRTRSGKLWGPQLLGDALAEFVNIVIHLDEEEEVATAAKAALTQLVPEVPWKVDPEDYTLHQVLDQAAIYLVKKYKKDYVRDAAFLCTLLPSNTPPAVSRVAALFVAYLTHRKPSFMSGDDMLSLCSWLHEMLKDDDAELRTAARLSAEAVNRAYLDYEERSCCRCFRRPKSPHGFQP